MPLYIPIQLALLVGLSAACLLLLGRGVLNRRKPGFTPFPHDGRPGLLRAPFGSAFDLWCTTAAVLFFLAGQLAVLYQEPAPAMQGELTLGDLALSLLLQGLIYVPFIIRYIALPRMTGYAAAGFLRHILRAATALACILIPAAAMEQLGLYEWLARLTGCPLQQEVVNLMGHSSGGHRLLLVAAAVIMAPIGEEVFFRGFLYNLMRRGCGVLPAALLGGLFFGAVHGSPAQLLPLTVFGIVQCFAYEKARSLWLPISVHAVFNGFSSLCIILAPVLQQYAPQ